MSNFIKTLLPTAFCDAPEPWQLGIQDPATPIIEGMLHFHNYLMLFLIRQDSRRFPLQVRLRGSDEKI